MLEFDINLMDVLKYANELTKVPLVPWTFRGIFLPRESKVYVFVILNT